MNFTNEQMRLIIQAEEGIQKVVGYLEETEHVWNEKRNLKLYDVSYFCYDKQDEYPDLNLDNQFNLFCEIQFENFEEWAKEEGIELRDEMNYIGRTSSFYLSDMCDNFYDYRNKKIDERFIECLYEEICGDYGFSFINLNSEFKIEWRDTGGEYFGDYDDEDRWYNEEGTLKYLADTETADGFLSQIKYYLDDAIKVAEYIDDFKENQVEYFKEQLQNRLEDLEWERRQEMNSENEIEFQKRDEILRFLVSGGVSAMT